MNGNFEKSERCKMEMESQCVTSNISEDASFETKILFIEPYYGGSHKTFIDTLMSYFPKCTLVSLPAKKWHWRARCGALMINNLIPDHISEDVLFCSSVLNLPELLGIRPELQKLKKVVYFHENQLVYPVKEIKQRDIQFAYNQIITCLAADIVLFNSEFNRSSFLSNIKKVIGMLPDSKPKNLRAAIEPKSKVLYFPIKFPKLVPFQKSNAILHIIWPHRWEHDKGPEVFFSVLFRLKKEGVPFKVSILGESFTDNPEVFALAQNTLHNEIAHFGYMESKDEYFNVLKSGHIVVSTAMHEFFGVSMLEAVYCGCYPLVPNALVYPEIYPEECLYSTADDLYLRLKTFCKLTGSAIDARNNLNVEFEQYSAANITKIFVEILKNFA